MKSLELFTMLLLGSTMVAQVGINTTTPQKDLHVAGAASNVRIEGLDGKNNINNLGTGSTTRVYADTNGDLTLGLPTDKTIEILVDSENYLDDAETSSTRIVQTGNAFGYNIAGNLANFPAEAFTLTQNAILEVNYSLSYSLYKSNDRISDQHARVIQTAVYFRQVTDPTDEYDGAAIINDVDGNPINGGPWCIDLNSSGTTCRETGGLIALNGQFYANSDRDNGDYQEYKNTGTDYVKLGPGTYVALFAAQIAVGNTSGTGSVFIYLGSGKDDLQIIAHYYN
ncbi:hypothetical protein POV27_10630 [Aureisphaera galaxeae]|uniref:hypothetical protein n=1 Tax=Aureisphaera galaxeae TaxID=1538023 RepID=UPI002350E755|nr:hypothetical protein [Aureisphaera galaxeae]MDC8004503.1 hypothetical protein [Aureisphaera galaxeae]